MVVKVPIKFCEQPKSRTGDGSIDCLMPVILYNIRHSVELFLKHVLSEAGEDKPGLHKINAMFSEYKHLIEAHLENESMTRSFAYIEWLKAFEPIISFVADYDPDGETLR